MRVEQFCVTYPGAANAQVVRGVDLTLHRGQITGLVGESGCGKTTLARSLMGEPPKGATITAGSITLDGRNLVDLSRSQLRRSWGREIAYISQDPSSLLNPTRRIGKQIQDPIEWHSKVEKIACRDRVMELLALVGLDGIEGIARRFPGELSGGQQQRVAIAIALASDPGVLILDEPTTGLDVSTQDKMVGLLLDLIGRLEIAVLWVSHDLALISQIASRISVMYAGQVIEEGATRQVIDRPQHPYTQALLESTPSLRSSTMVSGIRGQVPDLFSPTECGFLQRCSKAVAACEETAIPLISVSDDQLARCIRTDVAPVQIGEPERPADRLVEKLAGVDQASPVLTLDEVSFGYKNAAKPTLENISLALGKQEILGIVGESGSGKSTLLRVISGLLPRSSGEIELQDETLPPALRARRLSQVRSVQLIFQHANTALNPRHTVRQIIQRPINLAREVEGANPQSVVEVLDRVKLSSNLLARYPSELSGGQRQRLAIARSLAVRPKILLCDEITSALDVSVQAAILNLLRDLVADEEISVVFVSHNLAAVRLVCDRTAIMSEGRLVEIGSSDSVWSNPQHPYTRQLISVTPMLGDRS